MPKSDHGALNRTPKFKAKVNFKSFAKFKEMFNVQLQGGKSEFFG